MAVASHLFKHLLQHQAVQPGRPAETLKPWQETPGGQGMAINVLQARQHFVVQDQLRVLAGDDRLEVQLETLLRQRLVQQRVPGMMIVTDAAAAL